MALARGLECVALFMVLNSGAAQVVNVDPPDGVQLVTQGAEKELDCYVTVTSSSVDLRWRGPTGSAFQVDSMTIYNHNQIRDQYTIHRILRIDSFRAADVGDYICAYHTPNFSHEYIITLEGVTEDKLEGEFFHGSKSATLACQPSFNNGAFKATMQGWYKDGVPLSQLKEPERFTSTPENGTLHIDNPTREDAGEYVAVYIITGVDLDNYNCTVEYTAAPLILDLPEFKDIREEEQLEIDCEVIGYPRLEVFWYKDAEYIEANNTEGIMLSDFKGYKNSRLSIKSVVPDDAGIYTCSVGTEGHTSFKSTKVRVRGPGDSSSMTKASFALLLLSAVCAWLQF